MSGPLAGLRVLDLTTIVMGPYATRILGDYGADVIKIERPGGDPNRYMTPGRSPGMSGIALSLHRNKCSILLDLKDPKARADFDRLVPTADILVHNMLPAAVDALSLSYERLSALNPSLIYCVATGYGAGGAYSGLPAYDDLIQGASGVARLMARTCGEPRYLPGIVCDKVVGLSVVNAVLAAVVHRQSSGDGQKITVPMFETMVDFNLVEHTADALLSPPESGFGYARALAENRRPYATKDGYVCVLPYSNRDWTRFFEIAGRPELAVDERFSDFASRSANIDALYDIVAAALVERDTEDWLGAFQAASIPAMPVLDLANLTHDPHLVQTGFFERRTHPSEGEHLNTAVPATFSASPPGPAQPAPRLGQHNDEVLNAGDQTDQE